MIANKIKPKIQKVIDKFPTYVDIYRDVKNEFGEPRGKYLVCSVKGFYHEGNTQISAITTDKGQVKRSKQMFLMVILLHLQLLKIIKRHILSINKIVMLLGVIINIGVELWLKMVVVLLRLQLF